MVSLAMSQPLDIYMVFHSSYGKDLICHFPFSTMTGELDHHTSMFPDSEGITQEMYRRLQVRATSLVLNMCAGHGEREFLHPRNYYVRTQMGFETEIDAHYTDCIPVIDTDYMYKRHFQVFMLSNKEHIPIDDDYKLVTMTIPESWMDMTEEEKEDEWESQIKVCFDELYETHHVMG